MGRFYERMGFTKEGIAIYWALAVHKTYQVAYFVMVMGRQSRHRIRQIGLKESRLDNKVNRHRGKANGMATDKIINK